MSNPRKLIPSYFQAQMTAVQAFTLIAALWDYEAEEQDKL